MTCIVGIAVSGKVYLGSDSAALCDYSLTVRADPKVFRTGAFVIGFASSWRMGQLLRHAFTPPPNPAAFSVDRYMVTDFVDAARDCLAGGGFDVKQDDACAAFLVGYASRLFRIDADWQVAEALAGFDAIGCGSDVALGALHATSKLKPIDRLGTALEAAERFCAGVRGPFIAEEI